MFLILGTIFSIVPIPVGRRVCDRSLAGIAGSNPAGVTDVPCKCYLFSGRSLCRAYHSSRGPLPSVVCVWVLSWSFDNEKALAHKGAVTPCGGVLSHHARGGFKTVRSVLDSIFVLLVVISVIYIVKCQYLNWFCGHWLGCEWRICVSFPGRCKRLLWNVQTCTGAPVGTGVL